MLFRGFEITSWNRQNFMPWKLLAFRYIFCIETGCNFWIGSNFTKTMQNLTLPTRYYVKNNIMQNFKNFIHRKIFTKHLDFIVHWNSFLVPKNCFLYSFTEKKIFNILNPWYFVGLSLHNSSRKPWLEN